MWDQAPIGASQKDLPWKPILKRNPKLTRDEERFQIDTILKLYERPMKPTQTKVPFVERVVFEHDSDQVDPEQTDQLRCKNADKLEHVCIQIVQALYYYYMDFRRDLEAIGVDPSRLNPEVLLRHVLLLEIRGNAGADGNKKTARLAWKRAIDVKEALLDLLINAIQNHQTLSEEAARAGRHSMEELRYLTDTSLKEAVGFYWEALEELGYVKDGAENIGKHLIVCAAKSDQHPPIVEAEADSFHYVGFHCVEHVLPGEHGYRYFPSFYHNLFNTMQRTPIVGEEGEATFITTYNNLIRPPTVSLATKGKGFVKSPKDKTDSIEVILSRFTSNTANLDMSQKDMSLMTNRLFKMMTSCQDRRALYENMSWLSFIYGNSEFGPHDPKAVTEQKGPYTEAGEHMLRTLPQALIAMKAEESDARSYGIAAIQNLRDYQSSSGEYTDRMLNGPTSEVWLEPWKRYLKAQGVRFFTGHIEKLDYIDGELVPIFGGPGPDNTPLSEAPFFEFIDSRSGTEKACDDEVDYYLLSVPIEVTRNLISTAPKTVPWDKDLDQLVTLVGEAWTETDPDDPFGIARGKNGRPKPRFKQPLRDFPGLQLYFNKHVQIGTSYVYFPWSDWKITAIAQTFLWYTRPSLSAGYLGEISIDIGDMYERAGKHPSAWHSSFRQIADCSWRQIESTFTEQIRARMPEPNYFHLDKGLRFNPRTGEGVAHNRTPFMISLPGQYQMRPGCWVEGDADALLDNTFDYPIIEPYDDYKRVEYHVSNKRWVLCASYMPSHTRINTMEAANEIGRHAVNAILTDIHEKRSDLANKVGNLVDTYNMERDEDPQFEPLKKLDIALMKQGLPHFLDILRTFQTTELSPELPSMGVGGLNLEELLGQLSAASQKQMDLGKAFLDWMKAKKNA